MGVEEAVKTGSGTANAADTSDGLWAQAKNAVMATMSKMINFMVGKREK